MRVFSVAVSGHSNRLLVALTTALLLGVLPLSACKGDASDSRDKPAGSDQTAISTTTLGRAAGETPFYIDTVNKQVPSAKGPVTIDVAQTPQIMVNGWAVDKPEQSPAGGVVMVIDGNVEVPTTYGAERSDVAKFLNNPNYTKSGFVGWINVATITKGQHILSFKVLTVDRRRYYEPANKITLAIQ